MKDIIEQRDKIKNAPKEAKKQVRNLKYKKSMDEHR